MTASILFVAVLAACSSGCTCCDESAYDTEPLLASIRPAHREEIAEQAELRRLNELPLYTIETRVDLGLLTYTGTQEIIVTNRQEQPLRDVVLRLYPNVRQLNVQGSRNLVVTHVRVGDDDIEVEEISATTLRLPLPRELAPGEFVRITMDLRGTIPRYRASSGLPLFEGLAGLLERIGSGEARGVDSGIYGFNSEILSMGLWYPRLADRSSGQWDSTDPADVGDITTTDLGNYRVSITLPQDIAVVTTGVLESAETQDAMTRHTFVAAAVRSFAWQASRAYESSESRVGDVVVRTTFDRAHASTGARVGEVARAALAFYEQRFGPYP